MNFIIALENAFTANRNPENAFAMAKYMKNNFVFFGIKTEERRSILKKNMERKQARSSRKCQRNCISIIFQTTTGISLLRYRNFDKTT